VAGFDTLPEKIKPVLARMTAKDPDQRYPTAREVAQALAPLAGNSRTAGLLDGADEPPVAPVPTPPPQEWTRLTQSLVDTPRDSARDSTYTAAPPVPVPTRRLRWTAMVAAALVGLGLVIWAVATIANRYAGPPDLDQAPLNEPVYLLAHEPTPIGCDRGDNSRYVWSKTEQRLMFPAGRTTLFQMGMTTRTNFTFEVDLKQATPWPCKFGIYWGYREDATLNDRAVPNQKFAWFHYLEFAHRANEGKHSFWVHRGHGTLRYNKDGQIVGPGGIKAESEDVGLLAERRNVLIEIRNNRLVRARVGNVELKDVVTAINDPDVLQQTSQGGFGVFSTGEGATVTHARFILHSRQ
jgi:hypothetical protein